MQSMRATLIHPLIRPSLRDVRLLPRGEKGNSKVNGDVHNSCSEMKYSACLLQRI